jgi:hypothetical protein
MNSALNERRSKSRINILADRAAFMGEVMNAYKILAGKRDGKRSPGRPRLKWRSNDELYFKQRLCERC